MKITLIGASGFIGTRILELLCKEPEKYNCTNIDLEPSLSFNNITRIGDVRNQDEIDYALKECDLVILLAAQHRDNVTPIKLYYDTNIGGMEVTLRAMEKNGINRIIFFSSVAVYGLDKNCPDENSPAQPFNHYGKSKWQAEQLLTKWHDSHPDWNINIIRPTVVFGEHNRGNVYNLLKQISSGRFLMIGKGNNKKSMAYVGNIAAFVKFIIENAKTGYNVFNYVDKPDLSMNQLVAQASRILGKNTPTVHIPYRLGMLAGYCFDAFAKITGHKTTISSTRVKKFCATTEFASEKAHNSGFNAPYTLREGLIRTINHEFATRK